MTAANVAKRSVAIPSQAAIRQRKFNSELELKFIIIQAESAAFKPLLASVLSIYYGETSIVHIFLVRCV